MDRQQISLKLTLDALNLPLRLDTFDDRMVIQKTIYLCQLAGVHLGYRYNWYMRGPYSPDLARDAFDLRRKQNSELDEFLGANLDDVSIRKLDKISSLWRDIPEVQRPRWLELLASVLFLRRTYDGRGKDAAGLRQILERNDKHFSEDEVRQALEDLARYGLASAQSDKIIVDSIHGDIHLTEIERRVIDTASFQRLRHLKQLGMAQVTYPNATHTRFAHSIGVLGIMARITDIARGPLKLNDETVADIRLAGLLHDIGHYPYSHLMERVDKVQFTEEIIAGTTTFQPSQKPYPDHEQVGEWVVTNQEDLVEALGGADRAGRVASLFTRNTSADPQVSKLIHSSLDMDRLDYLIRDARATGVPHGEIDLNYLINNFRLSPSGVLGVREKAITAVDQFLTARFYMHRAVYYHKTTFGLEEACRQLLRRIRDAKLFDLPANGESIEQFVNSDQLSSFTDSYVDRIIDQASHHDDPVMKALANSIRRRRPPKLLREVQVLEPNGSQHHAGDAFKRECRHRLKDIATKNHIPLGRFLLAETKPLRFEERGALLTDEEAKKLKPDERQEIIRVFVDGAEEPVSVVNVRHSLTHLCSNHFYQTFRLYLVPDQDTNDYLIEKLRTEVRSW